MPHQSSAPRLKNGVNPLPTTDTSEDSSSHSFANHSPLQIPTTDIVSSSHTYPTSASFPTSSVGENHTSINENDIIIAVMGPTGAGKSSFVNHAAGITAVAIGYDLKSQTQKLQPVRCSHPSARRNIILVDTPGFDDTYISDAQILKIIANWLRETYQNNIKLAGIIYLHRISDVRLGGTPLRNLAVFKDLCGDGNLKNIVLATTMWDVVEDQSIGSKREEELRSEYWKDMINLGSHVSRFRGTRESAWEIIDRLDLESCHQSRTPLQIQREMVDRHLPFHETTAAKTLLRFLVAEGKRFWAKMRNGVRRAIRARKPEPSDGRKQALSRSSATISSSSEATPSISSNSSSPHPSPVTVESTSSGCSVNGPRETISATIAGLGLVYQMADIVSIPILRGVIGTVLHIAQMIQKMGGTHHTISEVIQYSGWLLKEITQYAEGSELSKDMKNALKSFQKELKNLQNAVQKISTRGPVSRFFLHDADIQATAACTAAIRAVYDKLGVRIALDNRQAIARLENQLTVLSNNRGPGLRQCECGRSIIPEELRENDQPSTSECW